jgi:serine/threonine-protein phosphatase 2A regulatory subunit B
LSCLVFSCFADKCIKLWKVSDRKTRVSGKKFCSIRDGALSIRSHPKYQLFRYAMAKRVYTDAHSYHIHSVSANSDCETFLSADDLRINWWNMDVPNTCFSKSHPIYVYIYNIPSPLLIVNIT